MELKTVQSKKGARDERDQDGVTGSYVKGVPFFNKRYTKGVPFLPKWHKKGKGLDLWTDHHVLYFVKYPLPLAPAPSRSPGLLDTLKFKPNNVNRKCLQNRNYIHESK